MKINGFTIAGFVFAIVALLVGGDFSFLLTFFGIVLSVGGFAMIKNGKSEGQMLSVASLIMLGINVIWMIALD